MQEIIINGKALPIHFGMKAISEFVKSRGGDFQEAVTSTDILGGLDSVASLTATGLNEGARRSNNPERYTEDDVWDLFDDDPTLVLKVSQIFVESIVPLTEKLGAMSKNDNSPTEKK